MNFTKIYQDYSEKVYRVCLGFMNDPDQAKDITQDTFIAVWQNARSFRHESSIGTWIYKIATNKCLRSIEKAKQTEPVNLPLETVVSEEKGGDDRLIFLRTAISNLQEMDRIIITLFMESVPQEEIAEITGLSHANVRVKVHRIKEKLLKKIKAHGKF